MMNTFDPQPLSSRSSSSSLSSISFSPGSDEEADSRGAYFNVFPDPQVAGNHITIHNRTGFMIKIGDTTGDGTVKGGRDGYSTHIPIVDTVGTNKCSPNKFKRRSTKLGKKSKKEYYWGKYIEWEYLKDVEERRNSRHEVTGSSEWYLVSIKPGTTEHLNDLATDLNNLREGFGTISFMNWGKKVSPSNPLSIPTPDQLRIDSEIRACEAWGKQLTKFVKDYDIWNANRVHPTKKKTNVLLLPTGPIIPTGTTTTTTTTSSSKLPLNVDEDENEEMTSYRGSPQLEKDDDDKGYHPGLPSDWGVGEDEDDLFQSTPSKSALSKPLAKSSSKSSLKKGGSKTVTPKSSRSSLKQATLADMFGPQSSSKSKPLTIQTSSSKGGTPRSKTPTTPTYPLGSTPFITQPFQQPKSGQTTPLKPSIPVQKVPQFATPTPPPTKQPVKSQPKSTTPKNMNLPFNPPPPMTQQVKLPSSSPSLGPILSPYFAPPPLTQAKPFTTSSQPILQPTLPRTTSTSGSKYFPPPQTSSKPPQTGSKDDSITVNSDNDEDEAEFNWQPNKYQKPNDEGED